MMIDADHFKAINDTYGHDAGDFVLRSFPEPFKYAVRRMILSVGWEGMEFLIICPNTDRSVDCKLPKPSENVSDMLFQPETGFGRAVSVLVWPSGKNT